MKKQNGCNKCVYYKKTENLNSNLNSNSLYCQHKKNLQKIFVPSDGTTWSKIINRDIESQWNKNGFCRKFKPKGTSS